MPSNIFFRIKVAASCAAAAAAILGAGAASAGVFTDDLAKCFVKSSSEADRATLVRWLFVAVAQNPTLSDVVSVRPEQKVQVERAAAELMQRLLITDCRPQALDALKNEGLIAIQASFQALGEAAGREMMLNPNAQAELKNLRLYLNNTAWEDLAKAAGLPTGGAK